MVIYSPGIQTKEKILSSAKKLFFNKGVSSTSLQEIANDAEIKQSLIYYYFEDKGDICAEIHTQFSENLNKLLINEINKRNLKMSVTVERCLFVAAYIKLSLKTPQLVRFLSEINEGEIQLRSDFIKQKYQILLDENSECALFTNIDFIILENISLNTLLFKLYAENKLLYSHEELIRFKLRVIAKSLYMDQSKWAKYEKEILELNEQFDFLVNDQFESSLA